MNDMEGYMEATEPREEVTCPDCGGYGVMGGRGSYYDTPGKMKPCSTCHGRKVDSDDKEADA